MSDPSAPDRPPEPDVPEVHPAEAPGAGGVPGPDAGKPHYQAPGWFTRNVFNRTVHLLTGLGVSVWGSRVLAVKGRRSGQWRTTPVNLLTIGDERFLVSPRGETEWVRNIRVAHGGELRLGRKVESFTAVELDDPDKPTVLRTYLRRWKAEVGVFFDGVGPDSPDADLARIAPRHPVFRVLAATPGVSGQS